MNDPAQVSDRGEAERVRATVRELFGDDHATYAAVLGTLAAQLHDAGDFEASIELDEEALSIWKDVYGEDHLHVGSTLARMGSSLRAAGRRRSG